MKPRGGLGTPRIDKHLFVYTNRPWRNYNGGCVDTSVKFSLTEMESRDEGENFRNRTLRIQRNSGYPPSPIQGVISFLWVWVYSTSYSPSCGE